MLKKLERLFTRKENVSETVECVLCRSGLERSSMHSRKMKALSLRG
jgi:hypothetical protein